MPIYEFYCPKNHTLYSFYARSTAYADRVPRCPDNAGYPLQRAVSSFSVTGRAKEEDATQAGGDAMDDPAMERALAQMEREFGGMDMENPDPRQMARMMQRMTELTGEKVPPEMQEMIQRMEAGEDPDKLEEEYADVLEDEETDSGEASMGEDNEGVIRAFRRRRPPRRDTRLYEMTDYLD